MSDVVDCRARVADTWAHLAGLDEVVSRIVPQRPYAESVHAARVHLEAARTELDLALRSVDP